PGVLEDVFERRLGNAQVDGRVAQAEAGEVRLQVRPDSTKDVGLLDDGVEVDRVAAGGTHPNRIPGGLDCDAPLVAVDQLAQQTVARGRRARATAEPGG